MSSFVLALFATLSVIPAVADEICRSPGFPPDQESFASARDPTATWMQALDEYKDEVARFDRCVTAANDPALLQEKKTIDAALSAALKAVAQELDQRGPFNTMPAWLRSIPPELAEFYFVGRWCIVMLGIIWLNVSMFRICRGGFRADTARWPWWLGDGAIGMSIRRSDLNPRGVKIYRQIIWAWLVIVLGFAAFGLPILLAAAARQ
jgi:hypothetical protein